MARTPPKAERIRADQAAAILGIQRRTIQLMAQRGDLPNVAKIGGIWTFDEAALRAWVAQQVEKAQANARAKTAHATRSDDLLAYECAMRRQSLRRR